MRQTVDKHIHYDHHERIKVKFRDQSPMEYRTQAASTS
ncbi:TPA: hypothetical protein ACIGUS_004858 [Escherichia coli]